MWTLTLSLALAGDSTSCEARVPVSAVTTALADAEAAYARVDLAGFDDAMATLRKQLPCVDGVLERDVVASVHRAEGLDAFVTSVPSRSTTAFAAARGIEPDYRFPEAVVPSGHAVWNDYGAVDLSAGRRADVPAPREGSLVLDGVPTRSRSTSFPTVFQRLDAAGAVADTAYLWPSMALPAYDTAASPARKERRLARVGLLGGAGLAAVGSGVLYALAHQSAGRFDDPSTPYVALESQRQTTNRYVFASAGCAALAAGAGVGGLLVGAF